MRICTVAFALGLTFGTTAHALYIGWGPWIPQKPLVFASWPKGSAQLVNRKERIGGYRVEMADHFRYQGNTEALNAFLQDLGRVEGRVVVQLLGRRGQRAAEQSTNEERADWTLALSSSKLVGMTVPVDGSNPIPSLKFPATVELGLYGEAPAAVKQIVEQHERVRAAIPKK